MARQEKAKIRSSHKLTLSYEIPISKVRKFWEGLNQGKIYATKCSNCKELYFPPQADCSACLKEDMEWVELSREGELEAYTGIVIAPASFMDKTPYIVAVGRLAEGIKVLTWLKNTNIQEVKVGMKIKLVISREDDRAIYYFVPLENKVR